MKVITWNCNKAFRNKSDKILSKKPDILIVPECESLEKLESYERFPQLTDRFWYGDYPNQGIGVFTFNDYKISILDIHNPDFRYVLPLTVYNDRIKITVFAIWAQKPYKHNCYTEQIWNAVHYYSELLNDEFVIMAGDFNSNVFMDKANRIYNHSKLLHFLKGKNILSCYHDFLKQEHGKEKDGTFFMRKKLPEPFNLDFCFASMNLIEKIVNVEVGSYDSWIKQSDHTPLIVTFSE